MANDEDEAVVDLVALIHERLGRHDRFKRGEVLARTLGVVAAVDGLDIDELLAFSRANYEQARREIGGAG